MRIKTRFTIHLALGLTLWLLGTGIFIVILFEGLLPSLGYNISMDNEGLIVGVTFGASALLCIALFGWYFGGPLGFIMAWIHQLSQNNWSQHSSMP